MLWWIINDNGPTPRNVSQTNAFGIDVAISCYAYRRSGLIDNMIFYEYRLTNHASAPYNNFRLGLMADMDLGDASDDFVGFDSSRRMAAVYNGKIVDMIYGAKPPMAAVTVLELPGDSPTSRQAAGCFNFYNNSGGATGDPHTGTEFYRLMHSQNRLGTPFPNNSAYIFSSLDSECRSTTSPGDRRMLITSNDFTIISGGIKKVSFALVVADSAGSCPLETFTSLQATADSAFKYYWNPPTALQPTSVSVLQKGSLHIYPNPAGEVLFVSTAFGPSASVQVWDAVGRLLTVPQSRDGNKIMLNTSGIAPGIYTIRCQDAEGVKSAVFVKK